MPWITRALASCARKERPAPMPIANETNTSPAEIRFPDSAVFTCPQPQVYQPAAKEKPQPGREAFSRRLGHSSVLAAVIRFRFSPDWLTVIHPWTALWLRAQPAGTRGPPAAPEPCPSALPAR